MYMYDVMLSAKQLASMLKVHCAVPEKIHTHPMKGHWKFRGGGGS